MKILILYGTAGIGHKKAAIAIKEAFTEKGEKDAFLADALDYTNPLFKYLYGASYLFMISKMPVIWGFFYYTLDNPFVYALLWPFRRFNNWINSFNFVKFLLKEAPQTVIVTHFFALDVIAHLKKRKLLNTKLIAVMTDYRSHTFWLSPYVDRYAVASEYSKRDLVKRGIPAEKILVSGIPCEKAFTAKYDRSRLSLKLNLDPDRKTVFLLGGGFGVGPIQKMVKSLDGAPGDFQCIVVCGYNPPLYGSLKEFAKTARHKIHVLSFVDNVHELMACSDVLVSKSGGITVTEALNAELPMVVIRPVPGQETRNYRFLRDNNACLRINDPGEIAGIIQDLFSSGRLGILKNNIRGIKPENAARKIAGME